VISFDPLYQSFKKTSSFLIILFQLFGIFYILSWFGVERSAGLSDYAAYIIVAFIINAFAPLKWRPFIAVLCFLSILVSAFGVLLASMIFVTGIFLIIICHLPIRFWKRIALILIVACVLLAYQIRLINSTRLPIVTTYVAGIFMFRLIVYLYEIKNGMKPKSIIQTIAYFFLFPNLFFLFFPIIDYKTFIKTYYNAPEQEIWQKGIRWMLRGIFHIFLYRIICTYLLISPTEIVDFSSFLIYATVSFSLIVRISGIFHLCIGLLCMFGFNLPQTFNNYFFSTGFLDFWRRINIYWLEFTMKIIYYPIMFKLKKYLKSTLIAGTMMLTFLGTWAAHSYQLFWVSGYFSISWIDCIFWSTMGICMTMNAVYVERKSRVSPVKKKQSKLVARLFTVLKIQGMMLFMSVLWALWTCPSLGDWIYWIKLCFNSLNKQLPIFLLCICGITVLGIFVQYIFQRNFLTRLVSIPPSKTLFLTFPVILLVCSFTLINPKNSKLKKAQIALKTINPNQNEKEAEQKSYYSGLMEGYSELQSIGLGNNRIKKMLSKKLKPFYESSTSLYIRTLKKNLHFSDLGYLFSTNEFGMRDKTYPFAKPDSTLRVAIFGASYQMGSGVSDDEVFEGIVEKRINQVPIFDGFAHYESLNFAVGGYYLIQHVKMAKEEVFQFHPDALVYFAHSIEFNAISKKFADIVKNHSDLEFPYLKSLQSKLGINAKMSNMEITYKLRPYRKQIIRWCYKNIVQLCKKNHCVPIWCFLLTTDNEFNPKEYQKLKKIAEEAGFITLSITDPYKVDNIQDIQVSDVDTHPNSKGHQLIANAFYNELLRAKQQILTEMKNLKNENDGKK
jgi:hypothetical protein